MSLLRLIEKHLIKEVTLWLAKVKVAVKAERRANSMRKYPKQFYDHLSHAGKKGMKWGYNDGEPNGKRTAGEEDEEDLGLTTIDGKLYARDSKGRLYRNYIGKDGVEVKEYAKVKNSNRLIGGKSTKSYSTSPGVKYTTYERGKIEQAVNKGRKIIDDFFDNFK